MAGQFLSIPVETTVDHLLITDTTMGVDTGLEKLVTLPAGEVVTP